MKRSYFLLLLCLLLGASAQAQLNPNQPKQYFIQFQNGQVIYANKIELKSPIFKSNYFLVDDSLKYNPSMVGVFQNEDGYFARIESGKSYDAFAKRILEGPRISKFYTTRTSYDYGYGYSPYGYGLPNTSRRRIYFFSKDNGPLYQLDYENLTEALADNASSMAVLQKYKRDKHIHTAVSVIGAGLVLAGTIASVNNSQTTANGNSSLNLSPAVYVGGGILGAQLVFQLFQKDRLTQAMEIYNYQLKQ
jgi:hypothetical protein